MSVIGLMDALAHRWRCCPPQPDHSPSSSFSITSSLELLINYRYKTSVIWSSSHDLPTEKSLFVHRIRGEVCDKLPITNVRFSHPPFSSPSFPPLHEMIREVHLVQYMAIVRTDVAFSVQGPWRGRPWKLPVRGFSARSGSLSFVFCVPPTKNALEELFQQLDSLVKLQTLWRPALPSPNTESF